MYDKNKILNAIWSDPGRVTGLTFTQAKDGKKWNTKQRPDRTECQKVKMTLSCGTDKNGEGTIWVNYNGGSFNFGNIWKYLGWLANTNDFYEILKFAADAYGIQPEPSALGDEGYKRMMQRRSDSETMTAIAQTLVKALQDDIPESKLVRDCLAQRGLKPSERIGVFSKALLDKIKKDLKQKGSTNADELLQRYFSKIGCYNADKYGILLPYYNGGRIVGFCLRRTCDESEAYYIGKDGERNNLPKYLFSKDIPKGGYCGRLDREDDTYLVEGLLDAEALRQIGYRNVVALGGQTPTDNEDDPAKSVVHTLQRFGVKHLVYVPDLEYDAEGKEKTKATSATIDALLKHTTGTEMGEGFISLRIMTLPNPSKKDKQDANSVIAEQGAKAFDIAADNALMWYEWKLLRAVRQYHDQPDEMAEEAVKIYTSIGNPISQQLLKNEILKAEDGSALGILRNAGVTSAALSMIDKRGTHSTWRKNITAVIGELGAASDKKATAETIGNLLNKAQRIQNHTAQVGFNAQINTTQHQLHSMVANKPEALETDWQLWKYSDKSGKHYESRKISFSPANINIIAAPTSHGKTLFMIQTALHLVQMTHKHFLYISLENDTEQLYIRALSAFIGNKWPEEIRNPKAELRKHIKGDMPSDLFGSNRPAINYDREIAAYWQQIAPYLHFVRAGSGCDELCSNIVAQVEEWRNNGEQVGGIFIDYMQLLHLTGRAYSRTDELKTICDMLNDMAKETGLPIIIGSQMNRDATRNNGDKLDGVELANLGESSGIENIAEECYLVWNTDRIREQDYQDKEGTFKVPPTKTRSRRICRPDFAPIHYDPTQAVIRKGCLYVESLKGREYETGCYCLLPVSFRTGAITIDDDTITY